MSTPAESSLISQLCTITNTDTPSGRIAASNLLRSTGWDLEAALNTHYSGGVSSVDGVGERNRDKEWETTGLASGSTPRRGASPSGGTGKDARPHVSRVGLSTSGTGGSGILWPIKMILRIVTSLWYFLVRSLIPLSFLPHLPRFLLPPSHTTPRSLSTQYHASPIQQSLSHIHSIESETGRSSKDGTLPAFWVGGYKEFLRGLKEEGTVGCVVVQSGEHEDDPVFRSEVLGDPEFIKCLQENSISIWACDIRYQEGYQVSQTLQITTYPTILFFSLLPSSTSPTSSSSRNKLTILQTLSGSPTSTTSASSLIQTITTSIVPRTRTFLTRLKRERFTAEETRRLREEQDVAVAESARKDREKMRKARKEVEERERMKVMEATRKEREEREKLDKAEKREKTRKERLEWRRWMRRSLGSELEKGLRVMVRLPNGVGGRAVRVFPADAEDVGLLFNWVETLLIPVEFKAEDDPTEAPGGRTRWGQDDGGDVVKLFTSYPRKEVENRAGKEMWSVVKEGGGSLVCEVVGDEDESDEEEEEEEEEED